MPKQEESLMTVGELARRVGVTARTIQYYDQKGLLHPTSKGEQQQRLHSRSDEERLYRILTLKFLGFSLTAIKEAEEPIATRSSQARSTTACASSSARA